MEGVEVHEANLADEADAFFFRADLLRDVSYRLLENGKAVVAVADRETPDARHVRVTFRFAPRYTWRSDPIVQFRLPKAFEGGTGFAGPAADRRQTETRV